MFLGHFAAGLVAARIEPRLRLGTAFLAAELPDALWPYFLLLGAERVTIAPGDTVVTPLRFDHYPWSHSLIMVLLWGLIAGAGSVLLGLPRRAAGLVLALVASHWFLDVASHRPDMPILPGGGPLLGLGLWNSFLLTMLVEWGSFIGAVWFYSRGREPGWRFWLLAATLGLAYLGNIIGPPPPTVTVMAVSMVAFVPIIWLWGNRAGTVRCA